MLQAKLFQRRKGLIRPVIPYTNCRHARYVQPAQHVHHDSTCDPDKAFDTVNTTGMLSEIKGLSGLITAVNPLSTTALGGVI